MQRPIKMTDDVPRRQVYDIAAQELDRRAGRVPEKATEIVELGLVAPLVPARQGSLELRKHR